MIRKITFDFKTMMIFYEDENGEQGELAEPELRDLYVPLIKLAGLDVDEPLTALI